MYYKVVGNPEQIYFNHFSMIADFNIFIKKQITILDISNPKYSKLHLIDTMTLLPNFSNWENLVTLKANCHRIEEFPILPLQIELIELETNRIRSLPENIYQYEKLESLNIKDNNIEIVNQLLPLSLRTINMGFNKIKSFTSELSPDFGDLNLEYNFLYELPSHITNHPCTKYLKNNEGSLSNSNYAPHSIIMNMNQPSTYNDMFTPKYKIPKPPKMKTETIFDNNQNVHNHDIQTSLRNSVTKLVNKIKLENNDNLPVYDVLKEIYDLLYNITYKQQTEKRKQKQKTNVLYSLYYYFNSIKLNEQYKNAYELITIWCNAGYTHSSIEYTYQQLLSFIIYILKQKTEEEQESIINILVDETIASKNVCLTGKFSRLVNVLNGFDDSIEVELNDNEIINNRMIAIRRKYETTQNGTQARKEAQEMLKEFDLSLNDKKIWIKALVYDNEDLSDSDIDDNYYTINDTINDTIDEN